MATRIGFQGFAAGVDVMLATDAAAVATGPSGWGVTSQAGDHTADLVARRGELQVAPEGINFEVVLDGFDNPGPVDAVNTYDPRFHNIYYFWDFGDPGSVFTAPQNIPDVHKDANKAYGPIASHTFSAPGPYTVTCLVIEPSSGKTRLASLEVVVGDAEVLFADDQTIFVSTDPTFARAPSGARTVTTGNEAMLLQSSLQSADGTKMYRVMFDREVDHVLGPIGQLRNQFKNLWWCSSPGTGQDPLLTCGGNTDKGFIQDNTSNSEPGKRTDFAFHDLRLQGYYDTRTETMGGPYADSNPGGDVFLSIRGGNFGTYALFHNVHATGLNALYTSLATHAQVDPDSINTIFNNTTVTNWANFAIYEQGQGFSAYVGVALLQDELSVSGNSKSVHGVEHGPVRIQHAGRCAVDASDMFSRNGWFENSRLIHTPQPAFRWNQEGDPRGKLNMQRSAMEGGSTVLALTRQDAARDGAINNMLIDKTSVVGGVFTGSHIATEHSGLTVRNCLLVHTGHRDGNEGAFGLSPFLDLNAVESDADYLATPARVYSNTCLNLVADESDLDGNAAVEVCRLRNSGGAYYTNFTEQNNILHQPNLGAPDTPYAPLADTVLFLPRYADYRDWTYPSDIKTLAADVAHGETVFFDYAEFDSLTDQSAADETPSNPRRSHEMLVNNGPQEALFSFDPSGVTVANDSGGPWTSGASVRVGVIGTSLNIRPEYGTPPDSVIAAAPLPGSPAIGAALSGLRALDDFYGQERPQYPSIGAFEVAG
ncbi:PKD domain-containing protein [uncultured Tateyamaria sp.]|uniref:PKD domain-containing protein n=1 Tax=uncultured Tateyamaria sp. TaxID=455651 RepID=UPI0026046E13|nr:PKD domain-containing protein [uncultured Tateyamaria sp.]